jgi:hypothetical protein
MKSFFLLLLLFILAFNVLLSEDVVIKNDNDNPRTSYFERTNWEESVFLIPNGPCNVKQVMIYFAGTFPNKDTIYFVGDPAEGSIPPTFWVLGYNQRIAPIIVNYDGKPGWRTFDISGLRSDGFDRICIQHKLKSGGPYFATDNNGASSPYKSFLLNPTQNNSLGFPGVYQIPEGDFMVRIVVEYDYPEDGKSASAPPPVFTNITVPSGIVNHASQVFASADASVADWNGDGWDDVAIGSFFFENQKNGKFLDKAVQMKVQGGNTSWADYNNDGKIDFYLQLNGAFDANKLMVNSADLIYMNNGDGTFSPLTTKSTFKLPYPSPSIDFNLTPKGPQDSIPNPYSNVTPLWMDYNIDGWPDLYLANNRTGFNNSQGAYSEIYYPDQIWKSNKDGTFSNTRAEAGIGEAEPLGESGYYDCYGANASDYNQDGKADIFVANYRLVRDLLFQNLNDGTFYNVGTETGVEGVPTSQAGYFGHGMGAEWGDFNNDTYPDLCVGNLGHPDWRGQFSNPSLIYLNEGPPNYKFREVHESMGLKFFEMNSGVCWADLDLDGYLDLVHGQISYEAKGSGVDRLARLYMNQGPENNYKLKDMTWQYGAIIHGAWAPVRIDFDNDGDIDLLMASSTENVKLFRNDLPRNGNWVSLRLIGKPEERVPMDAYGTRVIVYAGDKKFYRELMGSIGGTRCSQSSNELHFGMGNVTTIDKIDIIYPNDIKHTITNINVNRKYSIPYRGTPKVNEITAPSLISPSNFSTELPLNEDIKFSFYTAEPSNIYTLDVFKDSSGILVPYISRGILLASDNQIMSNQKIKFDECGSYAWSVTAVHPLMTTTSSTWFFTVCPPVPNAPVLRLPENNSAEVTALTAFSWNPATYSLPVTPETKYDIEISTKEDFSDNVLTYNDLGKNSYTMEVALNPATLYYWRVRGTNIGTPGPWSDIWSFTTQALPQQIVLRDPENHSTDVQVKPRLRWNKDDIALLYDIQVSKSEQFSELAFEQTGHNWISYTLPEALEPMTKYFWRIRGTNDGGGGLWSEVWDFITGDGTGVIDRIDILITSVEILPNPASRNCEIVINARFSESIKLTLNNILGQELRALGEYALFDGLNRINLDLSDLSQGMYYLNIDYDGSVNSYQIQVIR